MIFITKNTCKHEGCTITAKYNLPSGKKTGKYCFTYKLIGMINVSAGVCVIENCTNPTAYGASSNNIPTHCYVHRQNEMFDVIHKSCEYTMHLEIMSVDFVRSIKMTVWSIFKCILALHVVLTSGSERRNQK